MYIIYYIPLCLSTRLQHGSTTRLQIPFFKEPSSFVGGLTTVGKPWPLSFGGLLASLGIYTLFIYIYIILYMDYMD